MISTVILVALAGLTNKHVLGQLVEKIDNTTSTCHDVSSECDLLHNTLSICHNIGDALKLCQHHCNLCDYECKDTSHECTLLQETIGICSHVDQALQLCKHHCDLCFVGPFPPKPTTDWPPMIVASASTLSIQSWVLVAVVQMSIVLALTVSK